ncbi:hypothetical protein Novomoskovsk_54 [Bacillus phage Novomoskovsk]|uniref:Uncharacterized protein n=1 Tax=Bacillus phage Novomoskovsk TaxID=2736258 RepID=A0A6M9Z6G0_9CAUD|nr:hypothetical protein Novomoskovsk_54 [Bacillus phage Novomoskovsk]
MIAILIFIKAFLMGLIVMGFLFLYIAFLALVGKLISILTSKGAILYDKYRWGRKDDLG